VKNKKKHFGIGMSHVKGIGVDRFPFLFTTNLKKKKYYNQGKLEKERIRTTHTYKDFLFIFWNDPFPPPKKNHHVKISQFSIQTRPHRSLRNHSLTTRPQGYIGRSCTHLILVHCTLLIYIQHYLFPFWIPASNQNQNHTHKMSTSSVPRSRSTINYFCL